jgi:hypothetical protein
LTFAGFLMVNMDSAVAGTVNASFIHLENFTDASLQGGYRTKGRLTKSAVFLRASDHGISNHSKS